jgi:Uma2 family endonuclease
MTAARRLDPTPREDHFVSLYGMSWADYLRLLAVRGEDAVPRITYLEGTIEIMSPSSNHETIKSVIGCLVEVYCLEHDVDFSPYGSWTIKSKRKDRGAEPDECYVFGDVKNPRRPDLAIEVEWTAGRIDKLQVYGKLEVAEVWYWREGKIEPYVLRRGRYVRVAHSARLPHLDLEQLARFVEKPGPTSAVMRAYRAAVKNAPPASRPARKSR